MDETAVVFITLLLLLIITCVFGGAMRPSAPVQSVSMHNAFMHSERFKPSMAGEDDEDGKEGYEDDEEEPMEKQVVREVVPEPPSHEAVGLGMDGASAPQGYIAEEFATY